MTRTGKEVAALEERVRTLEKTVQLLGAELNDGQETADLKSAVDELREAVAAAKELPRATSADNGKVLGVVKGKWAKMKLPE